MQKTQIEDAILRSLYTTTRPAVLRTMLLMRTVVIVATVAMGALRIMWRVLRLDSLGSAEEWTAEE